MNVLFVVIDQLRADCLLGDLAQHVPTPNLDQLAAGSTVFANHYTVTNPCGPARASLLTGLYAHRHGAVRNGTPLPANLTNIAKEVRKLGYEPLLFGYTDSQPDPAIRHPNDPDLGIYEGIMPGFREIVEMRLEHGFEWPAYLRDRGYPVEVPLDVNQLFRPQTGELGGPAIYRAEDSDTAYLTNETIKHLDIRRGKDPWFAHVTYIRPHPPLVAPAPYHALIDPQSLPSAIPRSSAPDHPFTDAWFAEAANHGLYFGFDGNSAAMTETTAQLLRATYLGLIAEVDHQIGRLLNWLDDSGQRSNTMVVVTADHAEMLGDYGMWGKASIYPQAFHVPLLISLPGQFETGNVEAFTESIDIAPTILEMLGRNAPDSWNGRSLAALANGEKPDDWRTAAFMELEFGHPAKPNRFDHIAPGLRAEITVDRDLAQVKFSGHLPDIDIPMASHARSNIPHGENAQVDCA